MSAPHVNAFDTTALTRLRADLKQNPSRETAREVAQQFEALFIQTMLKSMRTASIGDSGLGSGGKQYRAMFDQQIALEMAQGQGMGLAPLIERQLLQQQGLQDDAEAPALDKSLAPYANRLPARPLRIAEPQQTADSAKPAGVEKTAPAEKPTAAAGVGDKGQAWETAEEFVRALLPAAKKVAERAGIPVRAMIAQAALETGWGQHVIRKPDGTSSFNLFGIKAHHSWDGEAVKVPTLEYRDGVARREHAEFRAYGSLEHALQDYADFLHRNRRYEALFEQGVDEQHYAEGLQEAGYATDPKYADKIKRIMQSDLLSEVEQEPSGEA